jgi:uncharacterized protein YjdB
MAMASCKKDEEVAVSGITLNKSALPLVVGTQEKLTATVTPQNASHAEVSWSSDNPEIASVTAGTVKAVKAGSAVVTAAAGGKSATCTVTVTNAVVAVTGVTVTPVSKELTVGEVFTLEAVVAPDNATNPAVSWSSNNTDAATVNPATGEISAEAAGTAVITATTADGGKTASCTVTVNDPAIMVTDVAVYPENYELVMGETFTPVATVYPAEASNKTVTWSSDNTDAATVNPATGEVTPVAPGTAEIIATTEDGGKTESCTVTVINVKVESVALDLTEKTVNMDADPQTFSLTATVSPTQADPTVTWSSDHPKLVSVDETSGLITVHAPGEAIITATAGNNKTATCTVNVTKSSGRSSWTIAGFSSENGIYTPADAVLAADFSSFGHAWYTSFGASFPQWIAINMAQPQIISGIVLYNATSDPTVQWPGNVSIETSNDNSTWDKHVDNIAIPTSNVAGYDNIVRIPLPEPVTAQYFKLTIHSCQPNGGGHTSVSRLKIFGD